MSKFGKKSGGSKFGGKSGGSKFGGKKSGGKKDFPFTRIGDLNITKSSQENPSEMVEYLLNELEMDITDFVKELGLKMMLKVYLPKGADSVTLETGMNLLVTLQESTYEKTPDYIVGSVSVAND